MRKYLVSIFFLVAAVSAEAGNKDSTIQYKLPDSVRGVQFMAEISISRLNSERRLSAGISAAGAKISLTQSKGKRAIAFRMHQHSSVLALGQGVTDPGQGSFYFSYPWQENKTYKLMISVAADSAANISIYTGYVFLPEENKWKLIGTRSYPFGYSMLRAPNAFIAKHKKNNARLTVGEVWIQRSSGSWKNLKGDSLPAPVINLFGHVDSVAQRQADIKMITDSIAAGKTDVQLNEQSVYYKMMKEGSGRQVSVNDTVVAFYKGYLFANGEVFDQTKDKPATFPLKRLIRGWQIGVPLCKVGGKIKLVIPSDLAYSIRTRAAKIPPNSILVFEIEVAEVKPVAGSQ